MYPLVPDSESTDLVEKIAAGDAHALGELHARYASVIANFVGRRVHDHGVAEEVCSDVWLGCWRSAGAFRGDGRVLTWLMGIAARQIHVHTRRIRAATVQLNEELDAIAQPGDDPALIVSEMVAVEELLDAVRSLPAEVAEAVTLAWLHELPHREIARLLQVPLGTVKSRVSRGRRLLRACLEPVRV